MIGQYSQEEFYRMFDNAPRKEIDLSRGDALIIHGKTVNFYTRHEDNSWTNYNCKTI